MNDYPTQVAILAADRLGIPATRQPWILAASPASLGLAATIAVALASAVVMIQPGAAGARVSTAIVSAVTAV